MAAVGARRSSARALWLRYDLRVDDNPALMAACEGAASLLPIYVFDLNRFNIPTLAGARKSSARRARFLIESVACLRKNLESRGSGLAVALGTPQKVLPRLSKGCDAMFATQGVCSEEIQDEVTVSKQLKDCELRKVWGGTLYMPEDCGCPANNVPLMFTSFKNKAESRGRIRNPQDAPKKLPALPELENGEIGDEMSQALSFMPSLEQLGYSAAEARAAMEDDPRGVMVFEGGEDAALQRVRKWMFEDDKLKEYFEIRNGMLGEGYSSKLSPWLALGCISPRRIWKDAQRYEAERVKNKSTYWLVFELTWRDFFVYMGLSQGDRLFIPGGVTGDKSPWHGTREALEMWKKGCTGDKLVDANMRELSATGFMSNRGRQNVASYLIFDLGVDWRYGAAHFEELLLDYDPCSNWGNWVAAAGLTGQRVNKFNTKKQLNDYDPKREYVKHWLDGGSSVSINTPTASEDAHVGDQRHDKGKGKSAGKGKSKKAGGRGYVEDAGNQKRSRWQKAHYDNEMMGA